MNEIDINLLGPFNLEKGSDKSLLRQEFINCPGMYFWTVKYNDTYFVNYIGISSKSIKERFFQHFKSFLIGDFDIYNTTDLKKVKINKIYVPQENFEEYFFNIENYFRIMMTNLKVFNYFFAPVNTSKIILELIESDCINSIRNFAEETKSFLSNYRLSRLKTEDYNLTVKINTSFKILGLPSQFKL